MYKVCIIGANGLLGSELARQCLAAGWEVDAVFNNNTSLIDDRCKKIHSSELKDVKKKYDYIFLSSGNFLNSPEDLLLNNVEIPLYCKTIFKDARLVYISSTEVYGKHKDIITEDTAFNNPGTYGLSKIAGEFIVKCHSSFAIIRPSIILGKGVNMNTFIGRLLDQAKNNGEVILYGDGSRRQNYIDVRDVIGFSLKAALLNENGIYLATTETSFSNKEIAEMIQSFGNCTIRYINEDITFSLLFNNKLTQQRTGYTAYYSMAETLKSIYN